MHYYGEVVPDEVKRMSREGRLAWHRERVQREEPAFTFLESLNTGMPTEVLVETLRNLSSQIAELEAVLRLAESQEFQDLLVELDDAVLGVRRIMSERSQLIMLQFKKKASANAPAVLDSLRSREKQRVAAAKQVEDRIRVVCTQLDADPKPYLQLGNLIVEKVDVKMVPPKTMHIMDDGCWGGSGSVVNSGD